MGILKSKDERIIQYCASSYFRCFELVWGQNVEAGMTSPTDFKRTHGISLRRAAKDVYDKYKAPQVADFMNEMLLRDACAQYGQNFDEVLHS